MKTKIFMIGLITSIALSLFNCVQETHLKTIRFKLDMRNETIANKVGVRGNTSPLSWNETFYLTDDNNDSIYEGEIKLNSASYDIEFKFVNQDDSFELQDQPNRSIRFAYKPEIIIYEATFNDSKHINIQKLN